MKDCLKLHKKTVSSIPILNKVFKLCFVNSQTTLGFCGTSQVVKNPPANAGDTGDAGSIPGSGRSPEGGDGNPFQYSCLKNTMGRGAWWALVHGVARSQTQLKGLRTTDQK